MKIAKKALASIAITGMALTMAPFNAFADIGTPFNFTTTGTTARLFGSDRIGTAIAVADAGWTTADTAILASSNDADLVDVLLAAPLAGKTSPILLTDNNTLSSSTQAELIKLGVKKVYAVGSISQSVIDQVNAINGVNTTVLEGADRIATANEISAKLINPTGSFVVGYGALADALSIASYAAANNYLILVANPDGTLPVSKTAYKGATTYLIGGPTLVADIPGATRLFGADRFATNLAVLKALTYKYDNVYVANGTDTHLVDSLVASSLAAKTNSPIVLNDSNGDGSIASSSINSKLGSTSVVTALGGHALVTDADVAQITTSFNSSVGGGSSSDNVTPSVIAVTGVSLNYPTLSLTPGGATGPLVATVSPANATNQAVTWTTSNAVVATVVNGVVTPLKTGTTIITATTDDGAKTATCTVTVRPVTSGDLGVAADLSGFTQYYPLLASNATPVATLTVAGVALPTFNIYDSTKNASFVVAPFNSHPAMSTVPSQGLTMNMSSDKNEVITNVDGYTLPSNPTNVTVNVNSSGEVSVNTVQLWKAQSGYKVVGYTSGSPSGSATLIEESMSDPTNFIGVNVYKIGSSGSQVATVGTWTLPSTNLPGNFEEFLGFNVNSKGQLQPMVASYFANHNSFAPYSISVSTLAASVFAPVEVAQVYASDKYSETPIITISNSLNSKTATVTTSFTAVSSSLTPIKISPSSVNDVLGGSQNITLNFQDAYGNPIANQTLYLGTGIPGLWITQVNGKAITGSVNMGTTSSPSMQTVNTPVPLFNLGTLASAPAYSSVSVTGLTATDLNNNTTPVVALTTGDDGTVSVTLADGNVTYVANTASTTANNSYKIDPGTAISHQLRIFSDSAQVWKMGSVLLNWGSQNAPK
ncbi:MAG: cell wall-binding repeat-containing protein [Desulfosporosinus sp.]|nr:cell wall-binding repeat-containing protein [Desulfosporosinus sp.]